MPDWLKGLPFGHYIIMAAIGAVAFVYSDLTLTKQALENERDLREQWQHVAETQDAIQQRDAIIVRVSDEADRAIEEAPNANTPIPQDVADAWAAGIDSVRNAGTASTDKHDLFGFGSDSSKRSGLNSRTTIPVLEGSGRSLLAL